MGASLPLHQPRGIRRESAWAVGLDASREVADPPGCHHLAECPPNRVHDAVVRAVIRGLYRLLEDRRWQALQGGHRATGGGGRGRQLARTQDASAERRLPGQRGPLGTEPGPALD